VPAFRALVAAVTADALSTANIRRVLRPSVINFWASCVTLTDNIALFLDNTELMAPGIMNIHAAALSLINISDDQLVFNTVLGRGDLRIPVGVLTTSLIFHISVEPFIR